MLNMEILKDKRKITLGLDLDGTLADSIRIYLKNEQRGFFKIRDISEAFTIIWNNWKEIPLVDKRIPEYVDSLSQRYNVCIVTATSGKDRDVINWLNYNSIKPANIIFSDATKKQEHCDVLIDDMVFVLNHLVRHNKRGILLNMPWSEKASFGIDDRVEIFNDWKEIYTVLSRH